MKRGFSGFDGLQRTWQWLPNSGQGNPVNSVLVHVFDEKLLQAGETEGIFNAGSQRDQ